MTQSQLHVGADEHSAIYPPSRDDGHYADARYIGPVLDPNNASAHLSNANSLSANLSNGHVYGHTAASSTDQPRYSLHGGPMPSMNLNVSHKIGLPYPRFHSPSSSMRHSRLRDGLGLSHPSLASVSVSAEESAKANGASTMLCTVPSDISFQSSHFDMISHSMASPKFIDSKQLLLLKDINTHKPFNVVLEAKMDKGFFFTNDNYTCYRRNYFQLSACYNCTGSSMSMSEGFMQDNVYLPNNLLETTSCYVRIPRVGRDMFVDANGLPPEETSGSVNNDSDSSEWIWEEVVKFCIGIHSTIYRSDKRVDVVQLTAKRDKGPQSTPSIKPCRPGGCLRLMSSIVNVNHHVTFERLQFKQATANNGKRRAHQQHFVVHVNLLAVLKSGLIIRVATIASSPLVVRGRSPGHYNDNISEPSSPMLDGVDTSDSNNNNYAGNSHRIVLSASDVDIDGYPFPVASNSATSVHSSRLHLGSMMLQNSNINLPCAGAVPSPAFSVNSLGHSTRPSPYAAHTMHDRLNDTCMQIPLIPQRLSPVTPPMFHTPITSIGDSVTIHGATSTSVPDSPHYPHYTSSVHSFPSDTSASSLAVHSLLGPNSPVTPLYPPNNNYNDRQSVSAVQQYSSDGYGNTSLQFKSSQYSNAQHVNILPNYHEYQHSNENSNGYSAFTAVNSGPVVTTCNDLPSLPPVTDLMAYNTSGIPQFQTQHSTYDLYRSNSGLSASAIYQQEQNPYRSLNRNTAYGYSNHMNTLPSWGQLPNSVSASIIEPGMTTVALNHAAFMSTMPSTLSSSHQTYYQPANRSAITYDNNNKYSYNSHQINHFPGQLSNTHALGATPNVTVPYHYVTQYN